MQSNVLAISNNYSSPALQKAIDGNLCVACFPAEMVTLMYILQKHCKLFCPVNNRLAAAAGEK